jgi:hypothetical protein
MDINRRVPCINIDFFLFATRLRAGFKKHPVDFILQKGELAPGGPPCPYHNVTFLEVVSKPHPRPNGCVAGLR